MNNQGFLGALSQYWSVEDKPRLYRRNSWFREHQPKESLLIIAVYIAVPSIILFVVCSMIGAM